jgi:hypothetical protein
LSEPGQQRSDPRPKPLYILRRRRQSRAQGWFATEDGNECCQRPVIWAQVRFAGSGHSLPIDQHVLVRHLGRDLPQMISVYPTRSAAHGAEQLAPIDDLM